MAVPLPGAASELQLISRGADGLPGATASGVTVFAEPVPAPVTDQGFVYFLSTAALAPDVDRNQVIDVYRGDGTITEPVSIAGVAPLTGVYGNARRFALAGDGLYAVECRPREDLLQPVRVWVWSLATAGVTELPLETAAGVEAAAIAAGGRYVAFASAANALDPVPGNHASDIFRYDRTTNVLQRLSAPAAGGDANGPSVLPSLDDTGTRVCFLSSATNLGLAGANGSDQVYLWRELNGTAALGRLSRRPDGSVADAVREAQLSRNGDWLVFSSSDSQLAPGLEPGWRGCFASSAAGTDVACVSLAGDGTSADADCGEPAVNGDGRFVVFTSAAVTLAGAAANGWRQVFLHDRLTGGTTLLSVTAGGAAANADCQVPTLSPAGRYVTFVTAANNLTADAGTSSGRQVYRIDRGQTFANVRPQARADQRTAAAGAALTISLEGRDANGDPLRFLVTSLPVQARLYDGPVAQPEALIPAGMLPYPVADAAARLTVLPEPAFTGTEVFTFQVTDGLASSAPAPVAVTWGNFAQGIVMPLCAGADGAATPAGTAGRVAISAAGNLVLFTSLATNLVAGDRNAAADVFAWDRAAESLARISASRRAMPEELGLGSDEAAVSPDGGCVVFRSLARLLPADNNLFADIYLRDLVTGATTLVSRGYAGAAADGDSATPDVSANGEYVVFASAAHNLVTADPGTAEQVYLWERRTGRILWSSRGPSGAAADAPCLNPRISGDGAAVVFDSAAGNLGFATAGIRQSFVYWRVPQTLAHLSTALAGGPAHGDALRPCVSGAGRYVAFESAATNLVADDTNGRRDIFLRDLRTGQTARLNLSANGDESDRDAFAAAISGNGRRVYFRSRAANLVPTPTAAVMSAFLVDRGEAAAGQQRIRLLSHAPGATTAGNGDTWNGALSGTGRYIVFASDATNLIPLHLNDFRAVYLCDLGAPPNHPPLAQAGSVDAEAGVVMTIALGADDPDQDDLVTRISQAPAHGQLGALDSSVSPAHPYPTVSFTPHPDYTGADGLEFSVSDGASTATGQVSVTIWPPGQMPRFALNRNRLAIPSGTVQGLIPAEFFLLVYPAEPGAMDPSPQRLQLLSAPVNGELRDRQGRVLGRGDEFPVTELPLTYAARQPDQFAVETLAFRARTDRWTSAPAPLEVAVGVRLQTLRLESGWNLISFSMNPLDSDPERLFPPDIRPQLGGFGWQWDSRRQLYLLAREYVGGTGYWLYVRGAPIVIADIPGRPPAGNNLVLLPGWNLVGPGADGALPQTDLIAGPAWGWDTATGSFSAVQPGGVLEQGRAYWLSSHAAVELFLTSVP